MPETLKLPTVSAAFLGALFPNGGAREQEFRLISGSKLVFAVACEIRFRIWVRGLQGLEYELGDLGYIRVLG